MGPVNNRLGTAPQPSGAHSSKQKESKTSLLSDTKQRVGKGKRGLPHAQVAHRHSPDPPRHPPHHGVLRVHPTAEEEAQVRREVVDLHPTRQVGLDVREAVGQREGQLGDRVRTGLQEETHPKT